MSCSACATERQATVVVHVEGISEVSRERAERAALFVSRGHRRVATAALMLTIVTPACARLPLPLSRNVESSILTLDDVRTVSPALARYTQDRLLGDVWKRPGLSPRDWSVVTVAALIARNQAIDVPFYINLALDHGVEPGELSEIITHLAFYAGWANAMGAVSVAKDVFAARQIEASALPLASPSLLPIDEAAERQRATRVHEQIGAVTPGLEQYTTDILFHDLWLRPGLAPRDRSLVTVSALVASGQVAQIPYHLNRAMDNGLTQGEAGEVITHLAFYAGWPNAMSAVPVAKEVFAARTR